jgi:hypothetical protein
MRTQILAKYPDVSDDARRYDIESLETYVGDQKYEKIRNLSDWGKYDRGFMKIALWLANHQLLTDAEKNRQYWKGIHRKLKDKIDARLQLLLPNHHRRDPYTYDQIYAAAKWVPAGKTRHESKDKHRRSDSSDPRERSRSKGRSGRRHKRERSSSSLSSSSSS